MPASYQAPMRGDTAARSQSQSTASNLQHGQAQVADLLKFKDTSVFAVAPDDTLARAVEELRDKRIGALVVCAAGGKLAGILSERDIVRKLAETPGQTLPQRVGDVMTQDVQTCSPDEALISVLKRMTEGRFRHMPVLDNGQLAGMVTIGDVVNYRLRELEHEALQLKQLVVG